MKIGLIGYGKMGKKVEQCALSRGHEIVARFSSKHCHASEVEKADVCIDFSEPRAVLDSLEIMKFYNKPIVIGTTGWNIEKAQPYAEEIGIFYSPNFSLGISLFIKILSHAWKLFPSTYKMHGMECHHKEKKDVPSGTAKALSHIVPNLTFKSIRTGSCIGKHEVIFEGNDDTIQFVHEAKSRDGFAHGALDVAMWIQGKIGFYTIEDYIKEAIGCTEPIQH